MTPEQLVKLKELKLEAPRIVASELENPDQDRTLLLGITSEGHTFHIYLQNRSIKVVAYADQGPNPLDVRHVADLPEIKIHNIPYGKLYPAVCDEHFCRLAKTRGCELIFRDFEEVGTQQFYGKLIEDLSAHK